MSQYPDVTIQDPDYISQKLCIMSHYPDVTIQDPDNISQDSDIMSQYPDVTIQDPDYISQDSNIMSQYPDVTIQDPDNINTSIPASTPVLSGSRFLTHAVLASFKCTSTGNPTPQISWKLGDQSILQGFTNNVVPLGNGADNVTSELTFLPIYADDGKTLYCYSSQTGLTAPLSDSIVLSIILSGTTVTLQCTVDSLVTLAEVYWRKTATNGVVTTINSNVIQSSSKYSGSTISNPSLTISNADFSDVGSYQSLLRLRFQAVTVSSTQYSATEGDTITLQCSVQGLSTYTLNWYKDNQIINTGSGRFQNGNPTNPSLTINSVILSDAGNYVCSAAIFSSSINSSLVTLTVEVADSISITLPTTLYNVFIGNSVTMTCNIQTTSSVSGVYWAKIAGGNTQYIYTSTTSKYGDGTPTTPSLTIYNVNQNDAGNYVCYGVTSSGLTGQSSTSATLNVLDSLATVTVPTLYYTITAGNSVTLDCNVNSNGQSYTVAWYFNGAIISISGRYSGAVFGNPSLGISSVQASDAGSYMCSATTNGGSSNSTTITLDVQQAASVSVPSLYYSQTVGSEVVLQCNINSPSLPYVVSWYFNGALLNIFGRYSGAVNGNPSLRITNIQTSDAGPYICSATTSAGSTNSSIISLVVQQVPLPTVSVPNIAFTKTRGDLVTLDCNVDNSGQLYNVTWYFNNAVLDVTGRFTGAIYNNPSLTISSLHTFDAGTYICSASTAGGSRNSSAITLTVLDPVSVTSQNQNYIATVGNEVILQCDINSGSLTTSYTVTWYYSGIVLGISGRFSGAEFGNPSLKITDVRSSDSGLYVCSATSAAGTTNSSIISLSVQEALPIVNVGAFFYQRTIGGTVTIECTIDASGQQYSVTWYRNNMVLQLSTSSRYSGGVYLNPSLTITNILTSDAGTYICSATTVGGSVNSSIVTLGVQDPPPTVSVPTNFYGPTIGDNMTLVCNVDSFGQTYTVTWYFNGGLLPNSGRTFGGFFGNPSLTITNVQTSDSGTYVCSAATTIGSRNSTSISVSIQQVVPTVVVPTLFYNPSIGDTITLSCSVQASSSVYSVTWYFNNIPIINTGRYSGGIYGSPSLTISNIQSSDTGSYICSAATSAGSRNGSTITVNVQQIIPTVFASTVFYQPRVGDLVTLDCSVSASGQTYSVTWYYNNVVIFTNSGRYTGATFGNPSLTISNVQTSDAGSYICSASTSAGSRNSSAITVSVQQVVPTVVVQTLFYNPSIGDTITLSCSVQASSSVYSVTWYFNNIPIINTGRYSGGIYGSPSLTISNIQSSDTGSYICSAATSAGSRNGSTITVNVQQIIPTVFASTVFYQPRVGDLVTLDCSVSASGQTYSVTWYYNNVVIFTNSGRYTGATFGNPSLTISNVQTSDAGSYICSAATSAGSRNSSAITISVQQVLAVVTVSTNFYQPQVGETFTIDCSVQSSGQTYTVTWYYNNGFLATNTGRYSGGVYLNPSLRITNAQVSDTGSYICSATTSGGSRNSSTVSVIVPVVTTTTNFYQPQAGDSVTMECSVQASSQSYSVTWYYNNVILNTNSGRYSGGIFGNPSLTITNTQPGDTGSYICSAATSAGSRNATAISLNVPQIIPTVSVSTFFYQPKVGDTITLVCSVDASGQSYSVQWYYNNALLLTSGGRYSGAIFGTPSLTISNVQTSDTGSYICSAATSAGSRNASAISVNVQQTLPVVTVTTFFYQPKVGDTVTLTCSVSVSSSQSYSVQWYYNNALLLTNTGRYSGAVFGTPSLTITNVQSSDTGSYICSATTSAGSRNGSTISSEFATLPVVTVTTFFYQPKVGETVTLACSVDASGQSYSVQWYYNNALLLTSGGRYSGAIFGTPSLTITNVQSSDTGSYVCSAATSAGSRNGSTISVNVQQYMMSWVLMLLDPYLCDYAKASFYSYIEKIVTLPVVTVTTFFYQPKVGETVTLACSVDASGQSYSVQWYYNNALLLNSGGRYSGAIFGTPSLTISNVQTSDTGSYKHVTHYPWLPLQHSFISQNGGRYSGAIFGTPSLTITNVQSSDTGSYICSAATSAGSRNGSTISVNVQQTIPVVTVTTFFYQPKVAETVTLECSVQASGQPYTVQWYYNNAILATNTGRYSGATFNNPSLTITNVQTSDTGSYICSAASTAGSRNGSTISLNVQETLPVVTVTTLFYQPKVTETVTLACSVQASGQPYTVQWYFNNALLVTSGVQYSGGVFGTPSLTINYARSSDTGSYICSAATSAGSRNGTTISVNVQQVPTVSYQPKLGETVTLDCNVEASNQIYTVQWYFNSAVLTPNIVRYSGSLFGIPSLSITNVQLSDSGSYICSAATSGGARNSSTITLNVQAMTETLTIDCTVQSSGQSYTVQWFYNNAVLPTNTGRYSGGVSGTPALTITNVQTSDSGSYICSAATSGGSRNSSTVSVSVQQVLPTVTVSSVFYNPQLSQSVTLECSVQASGQTFTVAWYYNNAILTTTNSGRYTGGTFSNPSLSISNLQLADSGSYICSAATTAGSRNSSSISLNVQSTLPVVSANTLFYQPKVAEAVTLECSVQASGQPYTVTWYYNSAVLNTNVAGYSGAASGTPSLTITNLQISDSGSYICSAATAAGSRNSSAILLTVQSILPTVLAPTLLYRPKVQESATLGCTVQASGQSYRVTWYYNNGILATNTGRYSGGTFGTPSLTISNIQTSDSGSYICSAATAAGSRNSSAISVTVQQILPSVTIPVNLYTPNYADSVTLGCSVEAFSQSYTVTWYYNNTPLSIFGRYSGGSSGSPSLSISGLQMSDSGSYICSAATTAGSRNGSVIILPVVTVSKNFYQPTGGESITLNCSVNAAGLAYTVRWYYNGAILSPNTGRYSGGVFGNPSFTISGLQISDSGSYICSASTAAGSRNSSVITLPTVSVSQNYYQPVVGTSVTLNCTVTVTSGVTSYTVQWYYNNAVLPIAGRFSGGYFGSPSLVISELQKSDEGSYKCSATNADPPSDVRITPSTLTVDEGSSISLICSASGSPAPTFSWSQGQRTWSGPQLNIPSSSSNDEGVYSCTARNAAGSQTATSAVFVQWYSSCN
ncbi:hypothetical protein KUTeg_006408 [Tegillarca granosa]|uniref:Ig-like domain-containing protein n=1 Tax=Tegillarca granosa TaxID=220873 RepID=A0ABQ9FGI0_TEGGR|nr:hypothetical protein KUTeg_006408 [Tegillarca granosa]